MKALALAVDTEIERGKSLLINPHFVIPNVMRDLIHGYLSIVCDKISRYTRLPP
jgi:hypothetical protein